MRNIFKTITSLIYLLFSIVLASMSLVILVWSTTEVYNAIKDFSTNKEFILTMLQSIGTVIISMAILDIAKYMIEEEVFRNKELREPAEARRTLTKIMTIISIAVSVEGLVYIFKAGTRDISDLIYPSILIITSVLIIVGLGIYQKLSSSAESKKTIDK
ncbi:MAG: hypothetical protein ACQERD_00430 [Campylobacterota bacterium]